jgi:hypothetical protein
MATRYGSDRSFLSTNTGGVYDTDGNEVISSSNQFGSFPLGPAALAQTLFSVPNGTFNLLPPILDDPIGPSNPLPYWDIPFDNSENLMSGQVIFDTTTNTYALRLTPGSALEDDTYSITTRSAVISDDNLALRQKAIATLEKVGTYAGTTQVNLSLSATYYDALGAEISTQAIGTVFDNGTISSITGFTTAGTAAVGISASYVDLTFTMTATANVTSGISFDINTILLQTSQGAGQSFLVTESFTSSTTWVRPTGVEYLVGVIAVGAGGGGGGGAFAYGTAYRSGLGGAGGGGGAFALVQNLYVGDAGSVSIGIGAAGAGGTTIAKTGTAGASGDGGAGGNGGATTFGAYITANGGNGGAGGILGAANSNPVGTASGGTGGTASNLVVGGIIYAGTTGASTGTTSTNGSSSSLSAFTYVPFVTTPAAGASGSAAGTPGGFGTFDIGTATAGAAAGYQGGAGGGGGVRVNASTFATWAAKSAGAGGAGGGGAHLGARGGLQGTAFAGAGGSASPSSGAGGGGGGAFIASDANTTTDRANAGTGGVGATGFVIIAYVG